MTAQTASFIKNTLFAQGQAPGSITALRCEDIADSFTPWDDPANVSGLSAPAILRGTISLPSVSGITVGAGQTTATRQATATAIQNAINNASSSGRFLEVPPGIYEIDTTTPITFTNTSYTTALVWRGTPMSRLIQFNQASTGTPVVQFGSITGTYTFQLDVRGLSAEYGNSQAGLTNTAAVVVGSIAQCNISMIRAGAGSNANPAFDCVLFNSSSNQAFSNTFNDWNVNGCQRHMVNINTVSTGNIFTNWYVSMSTDTNTLTGNYLTMGAGLQTSEQTFDQINFEHGTCNTIVNLVQCQGLCMRNVHIESVVMTGANPRCFFLNGHQFRFEHVHIENVSFLTPAVSGNCSIFDDYAPGFAATTIHNLHFYYFNSGMVNTPVAIHQTDGLAADIASVFKIDGCVIQDNGTGPGTNLLTRLSVDSHMPVASFVPPALFESYSYGVMGSRVLKPMLQVSATYTHYGQNEDATIDVPASITSFTLTLAATQGATGTQAVRTGCTTHVRRASGTAAGTLTVKDDAGTTLSTNTTSATDLWYVFNGTHYVTFTPVT